MIRTKTLTAARITNLQSHCFSKNLLKKYHIPFTVEDQIHMLTEIKQKSMKDLIKRVIPQNLRKVQTSNTNPEDMNEILNKFYALIDKNQPGDCYIGQGFYPSYVPPVIKRCVLQNPKWYTAYTPYQSEVAQGRLESLFNYQIMIKRLTGMEIANSSLLDEASAAAEAMLMAWRLQGGSRKTFLVYSGVYATTLSVVRSTAEELGIKVIEVDQVTDKVVAEHGKDLIGFLGQTPDRNGLLHDFTQTIDRLKSTGGFSIIGTDLLACVMLKPPGEMGADVVYGNGQRFGNPMGFGGPNAAFFAVRQSHIRQMPGRLISVSKDVHGNTAYRMSLQTREQHIRREKATSNICTAQVLLANLNYFYALYHGEEGLVDISRRVHGLAVDLAELLSLNGFEVVGFNGGESGQNSVNFFDTISLKVKDSNEIVKQLRNKKMSVYRVNDTTITISLDETKTKRDVIALVKALASPQAKLALPEPSNRSVNPNLSRQSQLFKESDIFNTMKGEHELLRYISRLETKDVTLANSMIALGSCTMKLNSAFEMEPLTHSKLDLHPFLPAEQAKGYLKMIQELSVYLCKVTAMDAVSYQSNSGATGEYLGLKLIKKYHQSKGESHRNVVLIPSSAHGTNPASAAKMGLSIVVVKADEHGYIDLQDFNQKVEQNKEKLFGMMMTYPSTHGVFEEETREILNIIHQNGGQVYIDGANMNAQLGLSSPGYIGGDVCHLNLHKTFCIPHGGGGPGMGPVLMKKHLAEFAPGHVESDIAAFDSTGKVLKGLNGSHITVGPFASSSILSISYLYIKGMEINGLRECSEQAILSANYLAHRLNKHFKILYTNKKNKVAHEFIIDLRELKERSGISEEDVAKRLMDFGFHAPTMSFPVPGTLMIEPTESENIEELERFAESLIKIREEIEKVIKGEWTLADNPLKNAPHTLGCLLANDWLHVYTREEAAYPLDWIRKRGKIWPSVGRIDNIQGDRTLKTDYS